MANKKQKPMKSYRSPKCPPDCDKKVFQSGYEIGKGFVHGRYTDLETGKRPSIHFLISSFIAGLSQGILASFRWNQERAARFSGVCSNTISSMSLAKKISRKRSEILPDFEAK